MKNLVILFSLVLSSFSNAGERESHGGSFYECTGQLVLAFDYYDATRPFVDWEVQDPSEPKQYDPGFIEWTGSRDHPQMNSYKHGELKKKFLKYLWTEYRYAFDNRLSDNPGLLSLSNSLRGAKPLEVLRFYFAVKNNLRKLKSLDEWKEGTFQTDGDANFLAQLPPKCKIYQGVQRVGNHMLILPGLKSKLDERQKEITELHEAIYKAGADHFRHNSSWLTRQLLRVFLRNGSCDQYTWDAFGDCNNAVTRFIRNDQEYVTSKDGAKIIELKKNPLGFAEYEPNPISALDFRGDFDLISNSSSENDFNEMKETRAVPPACPARISFGSSEDGATANVGFNLKDPAQNFKISGNVSVASSLYYEDQVLLGDMNMPTGLPQSSMNTYPKFLALGMQVGKYFQTNPDHYFKYSLSVNLGERIERELFYKFTLNNQGQLAYETWYLPKKAPFQTGYFKRCLYSPVTR